MVFKNQTERAPPGEHNRDRAYGWDTAANRQAPGGGGLTRAHTLKPPSQTATPADSVVGNCDPRHSHTQVSLSVPRVFAA